MARLILQPADRNGPNYIKSVANPVSFSIIAKHDLKLAEELRKVFPPEGVRLWGATKGNEHYWNLFKEGDLILFTGGGRAHSFARIIKTVRNRGIADELWEAKANGRQYEFLYFFTEPKDCSLSYERLSKVLEKPIRYQWLGEYGERYTEKIATLIKADHISTSPTSFTSLALDSVAGGKYKNELSNPETRYFIFDTKGGEGSYEDVDFEQYRWHTSQFNKVRPGDLFVYRRPGGVSETGRFYFFGACRVESISGDDEVFAKLSKKTYFSEFIYQDDLEVFQWEFKGRGATWENFFNQYGMSQIRKGDFVNLLALARGQTTEDEDISEDDEIEALQQIEAHDYSAPDEWSQTKRRSSQHVFSNQVKLNYGGKCAVCGINTRTFLVGSHIIPWTKDKENRLNPSNGVCFCSIHDKAFDAGYISLSDDGEILVSPRVAIDQALEARLAIKEGMKIALPRRSPPGEVFLKYHRENIFQDTEE